MFALARIGLQAPKAGVRGLIRGFASTTSAAPEKRNTTKPENGRKTYLLDVYKHFDKNNQIMLFAHHNNLTAHDNLKIKLQIEEAGAQIRKLKVSLFKHYLRASHHKDPASKAAYRQVKKHKIRHPLEPLLKGPTAAILIKDLNPKVVKNVVNALKAHNERLFIVGGRIGGDVVDIADINQFKEMPTMDELRSQLVGMLTVLSGAGLVRTLESAANTLYLTMDTHRQELEKKDSPEKDEKRE
ncbi:hypothetical protein KL930_002196 [Ogataea haglerorum]|uniref:Mitochondrial ribosomal protein of the large subunit n=1 Tax=Ogataea haglerorum TaxID=1937702 RepID=A0ABQ7RLN3_9ASCO|nr:uncharacterized protein KL911_000200 [Ogataea haglerorum]KAG7699017.1 hypothetical protein KL915_001309 [Ogataea haglerorum]KAG7710059.1 hypothetical protein KL914_000969 [Ogataea haglerorum]KAG7711160.1 hypothetical protein KL950_001126 [Ogataea haglerorum]KAG7720458.1 hypothetical protein KL913_001358 [Ogataea haglerorum]KAG7720844.1 hypothetical protein KL949_001716 [Ogataea haglerorum]